MSFAQNSLTSKSVPQQILLVLLGAFVYFVAARLGLYLATINDLASPVWPATGIAMGAILIFGPRMSIGIFLGAVAANYLRGAPPVALLGIGLGNTLEAVLGVWIFHYTSRANKHLGPHAKLINYLAVATIPTALSASFGTLSLAWTGVISWEGARYNWLTWWTGDTLGALFLFPVAVKISIGEFKLIQTLRENMLKVSVSLLVTLSLCIFIFYSYYGPPFLFIIFFGLLLVTIWLGGTWIYANAVLISAVAILSTKEGMGPFVGSAFNENLLHLQLFLVGVGLTAIALSSLRQEGLLKGPSFALIFGWLLTGMAFYSFYQSNYRTDQDQFYFQTEEIEKAITERTSSYVRLLESGAGFFAASEEVTRGEWQTFVSHMRVETQYPGINRIGVIVPISNQQELAQLTEQQIKSGIKDFHVHPVRVIPDELKVPKAPFQLVVKYVEPFTISSHIVGLDVSTEKRRLEAILKARDTGTTVASEQIYLTQDESVQQGFILFAPFYKKGASIDTVEQRRKAFQGVIYAPVSIKKFAQLALKPFDKEIDLRIFSGEVADSSFEAFSSTTGIDREDHLKESTIDIVGQKFTILWQRGSAFRTKSLMVSSWAGFCGALISLCLAILLSSLEHVADRAQKIAEHKTLELTQRERLWRTLTESSPVGIYLIDDTGQCTYINPTLSKLLGLSLSQTVKLSWDSLIHPEDRDIVELAWKKYRENPKGQFRWGFRFVCKTGILHVVNEAVPCYNQAGVVTGFVGTIQDMTELNLKQAALVASSKLSSLGEMAGGVAHEINNPLTIIVGKAQQLDFLVQQAPLNTEKVQANVGAINANVERIAKIIRGLRTIARDVPNDPLQEVRVHDLLQDALELCRSRFKHHGIPLLVPAEISSDVKCMVRPEQIVQVLLNLLNNSFDAVNTLEDKWVKVDFRTVGDQIQLIVTDSGATMSSDLQAKIFDPFFTTKEVGKGTGLGLSISRGIIEKHNGRLYVVENAKNTTFVIELKLSRSQEISA
ncbi:CHASE domain-containing protein [Bdellovibrio sp. HCB337]|uniref:CHASE domain-containing protein n=1 Tax=Bdellovibrio sp. HCB337 TaxID=3394358 RepID=UPI0039A52D28